jgi:hypothetical protein
MHIGFRSKTLRERSHGRNRCSWKNNVTLDLKETVSEFSGFLHGVRGEFTDDVSENAVSSVFTGHEFELRVRTRSN